MSKAKFDPVQLRGVTAALSAGLIWGMLPLYISFIENAGPIEIVAQRALWSAIILAIIVGKSTGFSTVASELAKPGFWLGASICTLMIGANWLLFVHAVQTGQVVDAAFGYFSYPLFAALLGIFIIGEKLDRWAWVSIGFVLCGVIVKGALIGGMPWLALWLAGTFGLYSIVRKKFKIDPIFGLFIESVLLTPLALGYLVWMHIDGQPLFFGGGLVNVMLAIVFGILTVTPLFLFHVGNRDLQVIMSSLLFYINPTTQLLVGIFLLGAGFSFGELGAFGLIWLGVLVYFSTRRKTNAST